MKSNTVWSVQLKDADDHPLRIRAITYSPDGEELLVGANEELRVYGVRSGLLVQSLRGHKDSLTCVAYARDGKRFATGSLDKQVIIWTNKLEGILKYSHNDVISCLEYNPVTNVLVSCSTVDFGLWSSEQKAVSKFKVPNAINACSWNSDGQSLALGYVSGHISIRSRNGDEKFKIERNSCSPIWALSFHFNKRTGDESLLLFDFEQKLNGFDLNGKMLWPERSVNFDAQFIDFVQNNEFLVSGGSNRTVSVYTLEGVYIGDLCSQQDAWIRTAKSHPFLNQLAVGTQTGQLIVLEVEQNFLKSRHRTRFVYRENMTDVVVQHLLSNEKVRIKCHSLVSALALYHQRLAIKLSERIIVYELPADSDAGDMRYKLKAKIRLCGQCQHLLIFAQHVLLVDDNRIQCFRFDGLLDREWTLDGSVTMVRPLGGSTGKESCLLGLQDGSVLQLFVHSQFPVPLLKLKNAPISADLSVKRKLLAMIDVQHNCYVYELASATLLYQELYATAVAWNQHFDEMLCFTNSNTLTIKCDSMTTFHQQVRGNVIAFVGSKVFLLQDRRVQWIEVTQSVPMYQYIQNRQFDKAFSAACQGVTQHDWSQLAHTALQALELPIATRAFQRLKELPFMNLLDRFRRSNPPALDMMPDSARVSLLGDVSAMRGQLSQAARLYAQAGHLDKAVAMYSDLRLFDAAQELLRSSGAQADQRSLAANRARWQSQMQSALDTQPRLAAESALQAGQWARALPLMRQLGAVDLLLVASRRIDVQQHPAAARQCAQLLLQHGQIGPAAEFLEKLQDYHQLAEIYTQNRDWAKAFTLLRQHPAVKQAILLPYAEYLAENGQFVKAQQAFYRARQLEQALLVLQRLTRNAVAEQRFLDAGYYSWILSTQCLDLASNQELRLTGSQCREYLRKFERMQSAASLYYAYGPVFWSLQQPFTALSIDALFNRAKFALHESVGRSLPPSISRSLLLYSLCRHSVTLGAYRFARLLHEQLRSLHLPAKLRDSAESAHLSLRCRPFNDAEELLPLCYRCSTTNPLYNPKGNQCVNCDEPFYFSFVSFEALPLVRIRLADDISDSEAAELLLQSGVSSGNLSQSHLHSSSSPAAIAGNASSVNVNVLRLEDETGSIQTVPNDAISVKQQMDEAFNMFGTQRYDREMLTRLPSSEVIVLKWAKPLRYEFLRNLVPEMHITNCDNCNKLFLTEELESHVIQHRCCPFCRKSMSTLDSK